MQKNGAIHFLTDKAGYGQMRAEIRPAAGRKLSNSAAKGTVVLGWPSQSASSATQAAKPEPEATASEPPQGQPADD